MALATVTSREKGGPARAHTHKHARTLPNPEALGPEIEEGAVTDAPFRRCSPFLGVAPGPPPAPAPYYYSYELRKGGGILQETKLPAAVIERSIGRGSATNQDGTKPSYTFLPSPPGILPLGSAGGRGH